MMYDYPGQVNSGSTDVLGFVFTVIMMALVIFGVIYAVRYFHRESSRSGRGETALDLLEKRYAGGEIDTKEFEEKRKVLSNS
jgi:putative membrane protein